MILKDTVNIKLTQQILNNLLNIKECYIKNDTVDVYISDLKKGSSIKIEVCCDECKTKKAVPYNRYNKIIEKKNIFLCKKCVMSDTKKTNLEKYGVEYVSQSNEIKNKIIISNLQKYGVDNPMKSELIKDKVKKTNLEKYGVTSYTKTNNFRNNISVQTIFKDKKFIVSEKLRKDKNVFTKYQLMLNNNDYDLIKYENQKFTFKHNICNSIIDMNYQLFTDRLNTHFLCSKCYPVNEIFSSIKEKEMVEWLKESNIDFIENDREVLDGKELDIYIPSKNLAIEFNGLYWHSELFKDKNYHLDKSLKCQEKDIQLLHIWEDEWVFKQEIIKSIIKNKLGLISNKIYARQTEVRVVENSKLVRNFLDTNHIQGYAQSSIKLGLFYNNELVSLMTFGYRHTNSKKEFELIRFCNKINLNVVGASSKLFNYFKSNYTFENLISYSDFRLFDGKMYETLGFVKLHLSLPDYFWCKDLERKHRFNFNKQKLIKEGYDSNKTETEIMYERNYYRVWGCGQYRWEFKN